MVNSNFELINIINIETNFKREILIDFETIEPIDNIFNINKSVTTDATDTNLFTVYLEVTINQHINNVNIIEYRILTAGVFKKNGDFTDLQFDNFCNINAPAIIFPFVRETVANLSLKGSVGPMLLQPVNFVELDKNKNT